MDRPFSHDTTLDGPEDDEPEPREERDPDEARQQRLDREQQHRADVRAAELYSRCHIEQLHDPRG